MHTYVSLDLLEDGSYQATYEGHFTVADARAIQKAVDGTESPATVTSSLDNVPTPTRNGRLKLMKFTRVKVSDLKPGTLSVETVFKNEETGAEYALSWTIPQPPVIDPEPAVDAST